jgi:hypothetical protein
VHTVGNEVVLESLPLPLAQPEYGAVKSTVVIEILNGEAAILSYEKRLTIRPIPNVPVMGRFSQEQTSLLRPKAEGDESSLPLPVKPILLQVKCWDFHREAVFGIVEM